jgi:UDP-2,3-diacylglucosamine pyrophosphatase LpxH
MRVESIFISDVHLGQGGCRAEELLDFLTETEARNIFVIGDLVDFWAMRRSLCWPQSHQDVLRTLVERANNGVRVVYIPGNHDEAAREFAGMTVCGVEVRRQLVHRTGDGRRMLLIHGDEVDSSVRYGRLRVRIGAASYSVALSLDRVVLHLRRMLGLAEWSFTGWLKRSVHSARAYIALFEEAAAAAARRAGCDGVICGHIHQPAIREIDGVLYCNDGDWVENGTSLVEAASGRLSLVRWSEARARAGAQRPLRLLGSSKA